MLVADGMSAGTLMEADALSWLIRGRGLTWIELYKQQNVYTGLMNMRSLNSLVTDSSAASSSWGSGSRIINGKVNQMGDGTKLTTLYHLMPTAGWKTGLVTTTEITHATPAGFATCEKSRDNASKIAPQYLERGVDVLMGGGSKYFDPAWRKDKRNLLGDYEAAGYHSMKNVKDLQSPPLDKKLIGLFARSHLPFTLDHKNMAKHKEVPTLSQMTDVALRRLERHNHFILQVEGGRVDHGCHDNDIAAALYDQIAFDEAIDVCLRFKERHPDTLIVITTDHGNGNPGLNGMGSSYGQSSWLFENLKNTKMSFSEMTKIIRVKPEEEDIEKDQKDKDEDKKREDALPKEEREAEKARKKGITKEPKEIVEIIREATGYKPSTRRVEMVRPFFVEKGAAVYELMKSENAQLGQLMANHYGISFTGTAHTADYVNILSLGPGAERFRGFVENVDVFHHFLAMAKLKFKNPAEPLIASGPEASEVEDISSYA